MRAGWGRREVISRSRSLRATIPTSFPVSPTPKRRTWASAPLFRMRRSLRALALVLPLGQAALLLHAAARQQRRPQLSTSRAAFAPAMLSPLVGQPAGAALSAASPPLAAMLPIPIVIGLCVLGMVPSALKSVMPAQTPAEKSRRKLFRRVFTGCLFGAVTSSWIFSGTWAFLATFALMAGVAQNEYFLMARENGCYPTWKLGTLGSICMYVPDPHAQSTTVPPLGARC